MNSAKYMIRLNNSRDLLTQ